MSLEAVEQLSRLNCTDREIAAFFRVTPAAVTQRKQRDPQFAEAIERGRQLGCLSIRRAQMRLLNKGSAQIAIWLGKQLLHQRDKVDYQAEESPVEISDSHDARRALLSRFFEELRNFTPNGNDQPVPGIPERLELANGTESSSNLSVILHP